MFRVFRFVALAACVLSLGGLACATPSPRTRVFATRGVIETVGATPSFVRIEASGESFWFETTARSTDLHITFSAECARISQLAGRRSELTLILDGARLEPFEGDTRTLCARTGERVPTGVSANRRVVVEDVGPGAHVLEVEASSALEERSISILAVEG